MKLSSKKFLGPLLFKNIANMSISAFLNAHIFYFLDFPNKISKNKQCQTFNVDITKSIRMLEIFLDKNPVVKDIREMSNETTYKSVWNRSKQFM
jgi:hypothetical protein